MIPQASVVAWRQTAPWADDGMVEQDLVLSRALVEIFSDPILSEGLAFRGGTALQKLLHPPPRRYSEDIDLVQVQPGPIGQLLDRIRARLDPWLGKPTRDQGLINVTLLYRFDSEIPPIRRLRLKVEINTREHFAVFGYATRSMRVASPWFNGNADLRTYEPDELLATKLRALYQRTRGRDLFDLWDVYSRGGIDPARVVAAFRTYVERQGLNITQTEFDKAFALKADDRRFLEEVRPMLSPGVPYDAAAAVALIKREFIQRL